MTPSSVQIVDKERAKNTGKPSSTTPVQDSEDVLPSVGPHNPALAEIYQRLYPEMRRPKPNQEAIAAALQAMQRLTMEADSEIAVEETTATVDASNACGVCGHHNRAGNKFCGMCGLPLGTPPPDSRAVEKESSVEKENSGSPVSAPAKLAAPTLDNYEEFLPQALPVAPEPARPELAHSEPTHSEPAQEAHPQPGAPAGTHHYHHHYHHHYFQGGTEIAAAPRPNAPESAREADRMRVAAAAKGEPMSRSEAAVRRLTQEWVLACNTRQLDELIELYAADALVLRSNLPPIRGAMAVREFFFASLEAGLGEVAVEPMRVEVVGDMAHEVGRYSALVPGTVGKRREERGKYLWVFAKQSSGDWKLVSECWSSDMTLSGTESDIPKPVTPSAKPRKV
jgi:ketosteroid isomerase-like protein